MARKSVNEKPTTVHPLFNVPEGAIDLAHVESGFRYSEFEAATEGEETEVVPVPEGLRIVKQTLRTTKSGQEVVDVVLEVDDVPGVSKYDLRVTPIE